MNKTLRVLMVIGRFYPFVGGAEKQLQKLCKELIKQGLSVKVVTGRHLPFLKEEDNIEGIPISRVGVHGIKQSDFIRFGSYTNMFTLLWYMIRHRDEYDIIHIHQALELSFIGVLIGKILGKKTIVKVSNSGIRSDLKILNQKSIGGAYMFRMVLKADRVIALTRHMEKELEGFGFRKKQIVRIPNGVEIPPSSSRLKTVEFKRELCLPLDKLIVIFVGSFLPKKNVETLIKAWELVIKSRKDLLLILLGNGPQRKEIEKQTRQTNLTPFLSFRGNVENVCEYLQISDIFVLPSLFEGLSNALIEAMSYELACIVSDIPANSEVIEHENNGLIFPADDFKRLAKTILQLSEDKNLRKKLGSNARKSVKQKYNMGNISKKYIALYEGLIEINKVKNKII